jgi:hypothetical protein
MVTHMTLQELESQLLSLSDDEKSQVIQLAARVDAALQAEDDLRGRLIRVARPAQ